MRVSQLIQHETLWSELYAGSTQSSQCLQPAVRAVESSLELGAAQRRRVLWRLDGGFGTDANLQFLRQRGYQLLAKGFSGRRAERLARQVARWDRWSDVWLGAVPSLPVWGAPPLQVVVQRRWQEDAYRHSYYVSSQRFASKRALVAAYRARGAAEIEQFRADKQALALHQRRKRRFIAQQALVSLSDVAHNLVAHFWRHALTQPPLSGFGVKRTIRDLLQINGDLSWQGDGLQVTLDPSHPFALPMQHALRRYLDAPPPT